MNPKLLLCICTAVVVLILLWYFRSTASTGHEPGISEVPIDLEVEQKHLENMSDTSIAKISVNQRGEVTLNGNVASLDELDHELNRLKGIGGVVWYHRDSPEDGATDSVMAVFERIVNARLPMMLFTDEKFKNPIP